jgi:HEPN domain-containing protein
MRLYRRAKYSISDPTNPFDWVTKAEEDYKFIGSALRYKEPMTVGACFHAQQCAEKYMKALLVVRNQSFPKAHDLLQIRDLCESAGIIIPIDADSLDRLSQFAVAARYPSNTPTVAQTRDAL